MRFEGFCSEHLDPQLPISALDAISEGILLVDVHGDILFYNRPWLEFCFPDGANHRLRSFNISSFLTENLLNNTTVANEVIRRKKPFARVFCSPANKVVLVKGSPIFHEKDGSLLYAIVTLQDIGSALRLQDTPEMTDQAKHLYMEFIHDASQELLQTPVALDPKMKAIYSRCLTYAQTDAAVLITGETGTGKDVLASFIQKNSVRQNRPFLTINCGAIPDSLLESELFGYAPGSFTGASKAGKAGIFEAADSGTLFLDEIGELPQHVQVKLLRVLESHQVTRVGATKPINIDVRIIAATNKNLLSLVRQGLFRMDLYYRINVMGVSLPPLRERPKDITALAEHFLAQYNSIYHRSLTFTPECLTCLVQYDWPGNVRELRNVIEQLVVLSNSKQIAPSLLLSILSDVADAPAGPVHVSRVDKLKTIVEEAERQLLHLAVAEHPSSRSLAKTLGVSQTTAVRKLKKYEK